VMAGSSSALSRVPGPPPRKSPAAIAGSSNRIAVTPDAILSSCAWPTRTPATSVMRFRKAMFDLITPDHVPEKWPPCACVTRASIASRRMAADVSIFAALIAGLVSFLSPCVLPLVPPYLVYLAGASLERLADGESPPRARRETVLAAVLFVLG